MLAVQQYCWLVTNHQAAAACCRLVLLLLLLSQRADKTTGNCGIKRTAFC
jgi:hypothetical protein